MFPGKESPWVVLDVAAATATVRDVKRAYAKLLKQFRPDTDPEGFRRIHDAYGTLLKEFELRDQTGTLADFAAPPGGEKPKPDETPAAPAVELPVPFRAAVEKLRAARDSGDLAEVPDALTQLRLVCGADPVLWLAWGKTLTEIFDQGLADSGIAALIATADILSELRAGAMSVAMQMLQYWHRERMTAEIIIIGKALTAKDASADFDHPASGFFALRLAFNLAIAQPGGANLLLDAAFAWLPAQARSPLMPAVENRMHIGRLFWHLPANWQPFWENLFDELDASKTPDWTTSQARRAVADLLRVTPGDWPGWGFIQSQLPDAQWQDIVWHFKNRPMSRRMWTAPPAKAWVGLQTDMPSSDENAGFVPRSRMKSLTDGDLWEIPDTDPVPAIPPGPYKARTTIIEPVAPAEKSGEPDVELTPPPRESLHQRRSRLKQALPGGIRYRWGRLHPLARIAILCALTPIAFALCLVVIGLVFGLVESVKRSKTPESPRPPAVPDSVYLSRIDSVLQAVPLLKPELEEFLNAIPTRKEEIIQSGGSSGTGTDRHKALLVCAILHPAIPLHMKQRAVDRLVVISPPAEVLMLLSTASPNNSPAVPMVHRAALKIYHEHASELTEAMRKDLQTLEDLYRKR